MGGHIISFAQRLARHVQRTDLVLISISAFALAFSVFARWLSGEHTLAVPTVAAKRWPVLLLPLFLWLGWIAALMIRRKYERPLRVVWRLLRRDPLWFIRAMVMLAVISATAPAYSAFKLQIPQIIPFYADPIIAEFEAAVFGQDPWQLTHAVFGLYGTVVLDRLYILWFPVSTLLVTWAIMTRDRVFQARAIATMFFVWFVLGNFAALALSSCGPVYYEHFYGDDRFSPLMDTLRAYHAHANIKAVAVSDWLLSDEAQGKLGTGISAMPSIHVGMTFLTWLFVQSRIGWRNLISALLAVYVAAIWIGSVHLAWHYWLDGAVSIVGAALFWKATGFWLKPKASLFQSVRPAPGSAVPETPDFPKGVQAG
ncbi:phosphatase PAP2 family protein [Croceicoccus pelagius]|uniref:phosphatase PAP2 family protein n=1 Tax=Croceicoccus pelagius TaxID=1703341 RepID=UPI000831F8EB|nr:phosphatase PAP2 family protein [Croceicoccus pelagius]